MTSHRKLAIAAGLLFIVATIASLSADLVTPNLTGVGYLGRVADRSARMAGAGILYMVAACCSVGIAIALYPVVKRTHPTLAVGAVVFRTLEAAFYILEVVLLLSVSTLSHHLDGPSAADRGPYRILADSLLSSREHAALAAVLAFVVGAFLYDLAFYCSRAVPRWLSGWGIVGVAAMLLACGLALFNDRMITSYPLLAAIIGVQEFAFAGWLLIKGFTPVAAVSHNSSDQEGRTSTSPTSSVPAARP